MDHRTFKNHLFLFFAPSLIGLSYAQTVFASSLWSSYNLGVTYSISTSYAAISYDAPKAKSYPEDCEQSKSNSERMRCTAYLAPDSSSGYGLSAYVEKPFTRQGLFYFMPGLKLSTVSYTGTLAQKPGGPFGDSKVKAVTAEPNQDAAPLDRASIEMYGINWQAYLKFGITPRYLPDLFLSTGLGLQTVVGKVRVFKTTTTTALIQPDAFAELEAVVLRFYQGYVSGFASVDQSLMTPLGTNLIADQPSGTETYDYRLGLKATQAGVRLLLPF